MNRLPALAAELSRLLGLEHPPVAMRFAGGVPPPSSRPAPRPAGCCFWAEAEHDAIETGAADHAGCSVGAYTHGFVPLERAAEAADVAALVGSGWVGEADLEAMPRVAGPTGSVAYGPLDRAESADVVLLRLDPLALMRLQAACPGLILAGKPQCQIVPLAMAGGVVASPGCAVSRVRTGLPPGELTCALPAGELGPIVERLTATGAADAAVEDYAKADIADNFGG